MLHPLLKTWQCFPFVISGSILTLVPLSWWENAHLMLAWHLPSTKSFHWNPTGSFGEAVLEYTLWHMSIPLREGATSIRLLGLQSGRGDKIKKTWFKKKKQQVQSTKFMGKSGLSLDSFQKQILFFGSFELLTRSKPRWQLCYYFVPGMTWKCRLADCCEHWKIHQKFIFIYLNMQLIF